MKRPLITMSIVGLLALFAGFAHSAEDEVTMAEIMILLKAQQAEIEQLKQQLANTNQKVEATAGAVETVASTTESYAKVADWADKTHLGGYGELHYNDKENGKTDEVDNHRFVVFVEHEFSDEVRFVSEVELEHSISGEGQNGEVEVEQAYIEWDFAKHHSATFGQFLLPVGIINETHEPDSFYGVERNPVEKNIIPATWWEAGVKLHGEIATGLSYDFAVHSGLETDINGSKAFDIRGGREKVSKASAEDFAYTGRIKYTGVAGLELALAVQYQEDIAQGLGADEANALFWESHFVYQTGDFALRGLYASWDIDGDEAEFFGRDEQDGWYIEPSYRLTPKLGFFARYSEWDVEAGGSADTEIEQIDLGLNYWLVENVVFKMDWADQSNGDGDSFNLGLGWSF
ncbi:MAG: OprO/OprP family phosphate-selective porin [Porticoccaceae bacterium]|nr:OprO/OprP family phosphate-selective porin [Porticoccaceae bacterium]